MTYKEMKEFLETLTEEQLNQTAVVFRDDETTGDKIDSFDVTPEDIYWSSDNECYGPIEEAKEAVRGEGIEWEDALKDMVIVRAGQVSLYVVSNPEL